MSNLFNKIISLFLVVSIFFLSSCASIFAPKNQKVEITKKNGATLLVDWKKPKKKKGKYLLSRKRGVAQLTAQKEGYKDENIVVGTYKTHPLKILTGILTIPFFSIPLILDKGPKSKSFDKKITVGENFVKIPVKGPNDKEIRLNNVSADIKSEDFKSRYFWSFKQYYRRSDKRKSKSDEKSEDIKIENTIFIDIFNTLLKNSGFIDTTNKVLKDSYSNNLLVNANLRGITFHQVSGTAMIYADITIDWEVLDFYKNSLYKATTDTQSGKFTLEEADDPKKTKAFSFDTDDYKKRSKRQVERVVEDAMEYGLIDFLTKDKVQALLKDKSAVEKEKNFSIITLPKTSQYVSSVSQAIESGVTIKSKEGHGSGFIISSEGHIITNYHVIAGNDNMKVVLNDGDEYDFEVVRESKIHDLALLKIDAKGLKPFKISNSKNIEIGDVIYAIGTPTSTSLSQTISKGIISGVRDNDNKAKLIQTDVSINAGNSGGALIDKSGMIIGVVSSKLVGIGVEGVAFGIPAYEIFDRLKLK